MGRLTEKHYLAEDHYMKCSDTCHGDMDCIDCPAFDQLVERLAAYEDIAELCGGADRLRELAEADKDGRVVVLPCKVGETVYFVNAKQTLEFAVVGYAVDETGISWVHSEHVDKIGDTNERTFSPDRFGKNTFFTREEAKKAPQEMEGKKNGNETSL